MEALAFLDLLGFSQMVSKSQTQSRQILSDFYNITFGIIKNDPSIKGNLFSDSLLAHSSNPANLVNAITQIYRKCLSKNEEYNQDEMSTFFLLPRGGISFGHIDIQERTESPNLSKNFIISPALVHSAKIESKIKGSRLLIADESLDNNQVFYWNNDIKSIMYENKTFEFLAGSRYYDSLWFLDLSKNRLEQKTEVESLIRISIALISANQRNKKALEQHLQTLRIGLLSYSKFLSPNENPLIEEITEQFQDDKYWTIWITLIEMIMNSPDNWAFEADQLIVPFYKSLSLKKGWSNVLNEIHKPNNEQLRSLFNQFQNNMN